MAVLQDIFVFTYNKRITNAVSKEIQEPGLIPGSYVSAYFRSYYDASDHPHPSPYPYLDCAIMIANEIANITNALFKVYLITDLEKADKIASTEYNGHITTSHVAKVYVDQTKDIL